MALDFSRCVLAPNDIIAQSAWKESAEQENQFYIRFVGVGVTTPDQNKWVKNGKPKPLQERRKPSKK